MDITLKEVRRIIREEIIREYREALSEADPMSNVVPSGPTRREMPGITAASVEKPLSSPLQGAKGTGSAVSLVQDAERERTGSIPEGQYHKIYVQDLEEPRRITLEPGSSHSFSGSPEAEADMDRKVGTLVRRHLDDHEPGKKYEIKLIMAN